LGKKYVKIKEEKNSKKTEKIEEFKLRGRKKVKIICET